MKIIVMLLCLTSCSTMDASKTVAGGASGKIDYCIRIIGTELMCIHAERVMETDSED